MEDPFFRLGGLIVFGMILGVIFFGGLWLTIRKMPTAKWPVLLFLCSLISRTFVVLAGIWYVAAGDATSIAACLLGFIALRFLATHGNAGLGTLKRQESR